MKYINRIMFALLLVTLISGCKSKRERLGDQFLENKNYQQAVRMYVNAEEDGEVSEEFAANISLALTGLMLEIADRDILHESINNYIDQIPGYLKNVTDPNIIAEYGNALITIADKRIEAEQFIPLLQAFQAIKVADNLINATGIVHEGFLNNYSTLANKYAQQIIQKSKSESDHVRAEYFLLEAEQIIPAYPDIVETLNKVRIKNRGNFLIFSEDVNGINPSPLVDKNSYIMAFPSLKISSRKLEGELQLWNTSGNTASFKAEDFILVSTDGKEVKGKKIRGGCEKVENERECAVWISYTFEKDFTPDYILAKTNNTEGRKYLGIKQ